MQFALAQSVATVHTLAGAQRGHAALVPPQSMSVSVPFLTVSAHVAAAQNETVVARLSSTLL